MLKGYEAMIGERLAVVVVKGFLAPLLGHARALYVDTTGARGLPH